MTDFRNSKLELVHRQPADKVEPARDEIIEGAKTAGKTVGALALTGAIALGGHALLKGGETPKEPNHMVAPTTHVEYVAQPGDTLSAIAADIEANGKTTIPFADVQKYLKTEINPDAPGVINPDDSTLQVGEKVVGNVPVNPQAEAQLPPPAETK